MAVILALGNSFFFLLGSITAKRHVQHFDLNLGVFLRARQNKGGYKKRRASLKPRAGQDGARKGKARLLLLIFDGSVPRLVLLSGFMDADLPLESWVSNALDPIKNQAVIRWFNEKRGVWTNIL